MIIRALSLIAGASLALAGPTPAQIPTLLITVSARGAYEGFPVPGRWLACRPLELHAAPVTSSPVVVNVQRGDSIHALDGEIHVTALGIVVLRDSLTVGPNDSYTGPQGAQGLRLTPGDTVYPAVYVEELGWDWWYHGTRHHSLRFWFSASTAHPAVIIREPVREDWIQLRTPAGATGWWRADFRKVDAGSGLGVNLCSPH